MLTLRFFPRSSFCKHQTLLHFFSLYPWTTIIRRFAGGVGFLVRFLDIYQVTQALATVLQNPKQMADMRRAWGQIDFESVRNQSALVCNCRHEDLVQLLEIDFVAVLERLATRSSEPVRDVIVWADECCDRLIGAGVAAARGGEDRSTLSSRSVLIRWGYVTSQIMRDLVRDCCECG